MLLSKLKRRVRIEGGMNDLAGYQVHIFDVETGEEIENVTKAVITLLPGECTIIELTYMEPREDNPLLYTEETMCINSPQFALTAWERRR